MALFLPWEKTGINPVCSEGENIFGYIRSNASHALIYYAHNSILYVEVGDFIKPGNTIAYVGRTGLNASGEREENIANRETGVRKRVDACKRDKWDRREKK